MIISPFGREKLVPSFRKIVHGVIGVLCVVGSSETVLVHTVAVHLVVGTGTVVLVDKSRNFDPENIAAAYMYMSVDYIV